MELLDPLLVSLPEPDFGFNNSDFRDSMLELLVLLSILFVDG